MTNTDEIPTTAQNLLTDLGEEYTRAVSSPLPKQPQAMGWQMIAATRTAGFTRALHALREVAPERADEIAAWFDGPFGEGPELPEHTDWLITHVAASRAQFDQWVDAGHRAAVDAQQAALPEASA
ncbi:hypothetical protein [Streptomyces sp. Da 82-17]|uniref:hypothetical protein n=1 Tax=Streptomyces sp. Da 82-17 TaxID=3377116 RepID=UPI0038D4C897